MLLLSSAIDVFYLQHSAPPDIRISVECPFRVQRNPFWFVQALMDYKRPMQTQVHLSPPPLRTEVCEVKGQTVTCQEKFQHNC